MTDQNKNTISELLDLANHYPSPHNGQPVCMKQVGDNAFELYFERERGLQAADISFIFSFVSMGVFVQHLAYVAEALGHGFSYELSLPSEEDLHGSGVVKFGTCRFDWYATDPQAGLQQTLRFRQTSRKKYTEGVSAELAEKLIQLAAAEQMKLTELGKDATKQAIWLNQRAVFDDMFDEPVRRELDHWLRYSQAEKQAKRDGLAYDCMELNGSVMKWITRHPKILRAPGISGALQRYYLRTMTDSSDVFYMLAPFRTGQQAFAVGVSIMKLWKTITENGLYLHPFGTIMSNHRAHQDFLRIAGLQSDSREDGYLVFIFRAGKSEPPVPSLRLPYDKHLILEN